MHPAVRSSTVKRMHSMLCVGVVACLDVDGLATTLTQQYHAQAAQAVTCTERACLIMRTVAAHLLHCFASNCQAQYL
jgi:hypothetical protein